MARAQCHGGGTCVTWHERMYPLCQCICCIYHIYCTRINHMHICVHGSRRIHHACSSLRAWPWAPENFQMEKCPHSFVCCCFLLLFCVYLFLWMRRVSPLAASTNCFQKFPIWNSFRQSCFGALKMRWQRHLLTRSCWYMYLFETLCQRHDVHVCVHTMQFKFEKQRLPINEWTKASLCLFLMRVRLAWAAHDVLRRVMLKQRSACANAGWGAHRICCLERITKDMQDSLLIKTRIWPETKPHFWSESQKRISVVRDKSKVAHRAPLVNDLHWPLQLMVISRDWQNWPLPLLFQLNTLTRKMSESCYSRDTPGVSTRGPWKVRGDLLLIARIKVEMIN